MGHCPNCNQTLEKELLHCPHCGQLIQRDAAGEAIHPGDQNTETVDFIRRSKRTLMNLNALTLGEDAAESENQATPPSHDPQAASDGSATIEFLDKSQTTVDIVSGDDSPVVGTVDFADTAEAQQPANTGSSTVDWDQPTASGEEPNEGDKTVDFSGKGDATVDIVQGDISQPETDGSKTVEFLGNSERTVDAAHGNELIEEATVESEHPPIANGNLTVEFQDNSNPTVDIDDEQDSPVGKTVDQAPSRNAKLTKSNRPVQQTTSGKTFNVSSVDTAHATYQPESLGTAGRLNQLWNGVAGESKNPMHSLQGVGLQASDTVFARVATRRVADAQPVPDTHADYQILKKLGEGAMGIVYSARQVGVNRVIALKTAKPSYQKNDESRRRFLYEAHITAELDHSNIVPIHELGSSEEGNLFYAMKLVQGTEWNRVIRKNTRDENIDIFMKVADAMAFAHSKGVVHRDLKPENTMLGKYGEVFVTDWGTAININRDSTTLAAPAAAGDKFLSVVDGRGFAKNDALALHNGEEILERCQIKQVDPAHPNRIYIRKAISRDFQPSEELRVLKVMNLAGTPCFMAPEMAGHHLPKIGTRSDIYILGAILYEIVTGRAPHSGSSVTECLRAALVNNIVRPNNEDPLLTIAYKAMATEPKDRYQTVEELQEAVREYRRHAESVKLANRSEELLARAIEKSDYEMFSRTLFGYRDAVDLWPENTSAVLGLEKARLAFGHCAFDKGDYDLVLQTVDRNVADEATLYAQAVDAKHKAEGREAKLKLLQKAIAAIVLFAVVGLSGLSYYALRESARATLAAKKEKIERDKAVQLADEKVLLAESEKAAKNVALLAQQAAEESALSEERAKNEALVAKQRAEDSAASETIAKDLAIEARKSAEDATQRELVAKNEAIQAANLAKLRAAQIQLGEYNSSLALAKSQIDSFDVSAGRQSLTRLKNLTSDVFFGKNPDFDTWGLRRISLLSNADLPSSQIAGSVTASTYSSAAQLAVIGTSDGLIQVLRNAQNGLEKAEQHVESGATINTIAVSPDGQEVVFGFTRDQSHGVKRWALSQDSVQPVVATEQRLFQQLAYSTDGKYLVAGINGGLWIWDRAANWFNQDLPTRRADGIRGELRSLQGISSHEILIVAGFQKRVLIGMLDLQSGNTRLIAVPDGLDSELSSAAHTLVDNKILLGLSDNRLLFGTLDSESDSILDLTQLEEKHRAPVTQIVANGKGQLITVSADEPVAHVWHFVDGNLQYDTFLTGTPNNIAGVGMLAANRVIGVDVDGTSIVWDVKRQKQRRRLERQSSSAAQALVSQEYVSPVQGVFPGSSSASALAIDGNGVVDLWSLVDGATQQIDSQRWSYIGHTPGVELVDSAVDLERGIVVTAASLKNAEHRYLPHPEHDWEFCIWDQDTGGMLLRWTAPNRRVADTNRPETIEQRISLVDDGQQILYASDNETRLVELASGKETFGRTDFGTYFAVPNPKTPSMLMLVKRSGAVRLLDIEDVNSWDKAQYRNYLLADPSDIPLRGTWTDDGKRFYLTFATGGLAMFSWLDDKLELSWSSRRLAGELQSTELRDAFASQSARVQSHLDIDMLVTTADSGELVHVATRHRGQDASTKLMSLAFDGGSLNPRLVEVQRTAGIQWLQHRNQSAPELTSEFHDVLVVDGKRIRSRLSFGTQTFVSTGSAQVYGLAEGNLRSMSYGRSPLVSATGSRDGKAIFALLADGAIWNFTFSPAGEANWTRLSYDATDATNIKLSPSGSQLLIQTQGHARLVHAIDGTLLNDLGELSTAAWDTGLEDRLALCRIDGGLELFENGKYTKLERAVDVQDSDQVLGLHFFNETWSDEHAPARRHLLIQTENETHGNLHFVPIDVLAANEEAPAEVALENGANLPGNEAKTLAQISKGTLLTVSPTEGILVTGAPTGTVTVWFATPTWEHSPRQLFDLEGHRGAAVTCLEFSNDGRTLVSADNENRLYAWLSEDPTMGAATD